AGLAGVAEAEGVEGGAVERRAVAVVDRLSVHEGGGRYHPGARSGPWGPGAYASRGMSPASTRSRKARQTATGRALSHDVPVVSVTISRIVFTRLPTTWAERPRSSPIAWYVSPATTRSAIARMCSRLRGRPIEGSCTASAQVAPVSVFR